MPISWAERHRRSPCSIDGCSEPIQARRLCNKHYKRWRRQGDPQKLVRTEPGAALKFAKYAARYQGEDCLIWPFARGGNGEARLHRRTPNKEERGACRYICILVHGLPPTPSHQAAHSCGKGHLGCVNGGHLRWTTPAENQADRHEHGTAHLGESHPNAKLTDEKVRFIRRMAPHLPQRVVGEMVGVSQACVSDVVTGRAWTHVEVSR